jgi:hypothetical protein
MSLAETLAGGALLAVGVIGAIAAARDRGDDAGAAGRCHWAGCHAPARQRYCQQHTAMIHDINRRSGN